MKKLIFIVLSLSTLSFAGLAQRPVVSGISLKSAPVQDTVLITGSNLPTGTNAHVQFGAAKGSITAATSSQIKAVVPPGASFGGITVTNTTDGLSSKSIDPFMLSFGGASFDLSKFTTDEAVTGYSGMNDLCSCDFNNDGKVDVVTSHTNGFSKILSAFRYDITAASPYFSRTQVTSNIYTSNIICGDLDGDGRPDLAATGAGVDAGKVVLLKNIGSTTGGSLGFGIPIHLTLPGGSGGMIAMQDLNGDGRPDLVISNNSTNVVTVFRNASSGGSLLFDSQAQNISITGPATTHGLSVQDLDGDGLPDLAVAGFQEKNVYAMRNTSSGNTISFGTPTTLATASQSFLVYLVAADLNGDGKADLAATDNENGKLYVWINGSSSGSLQFGAASLFDTGVSPWGIAAGDVDGNGKADLVVSHTGTTGSKSLKIYHNSSAGGTLQLTAADLVTTEAGKHVNIVDYSGDGKPDLAYTGRTNNTLRIFRNKHCVVPTLSRTGTITLCTDQKIHLQATPALFVTYTWTRNGITLPTTGSKHIITEAGDYAVTITSTADGCSQTSSILKVVSGSGGGGGVAMEPIAAVCVGGSTQLKATALSGATYIWNGPNGFTATTTTASYSLTNVQSVAAGSYSVVIKSGDCQFTPAAQTLTVYAAPQPVISASPATTFCAGTSVTLSVQDGFSSYQWKLNGANYSGTGATTRSISTTTAGTYTVLVGNSSGCSAESPGVSITKVQVPVANFTAPTTACMEQAVTFQNNSTYDSGQTPAYLWSFGDGQTSSAENPAHTYMATGTYTVSLTVSYGSLSCSSSISKTISVVATPSVDLISDLIPIFCPGDSIQLRLEGDIASAVWSNGATGTEIWAKDAGIYIADVLTNGGCTIQRSIEVSHLEKPTISISASATTIYRGESAELVAEGGLSYQWAAAEGITELNSQTVKVSPIQTTTYTVTGWNENSCYSTAEITIVIDNTLRISPPKIFVPKVDSNWSIPEMHLYPDISLTIVNSLGRSIYHAFPYTNNWDGTEQGRALEAGVYYYIFKDASGNVLKTGSITLLR